MAQAKRDENSVATLLGVSSVDGVTPVVLWADPTTHRLLTDSATGMSNPMTTGGDLIYGGVGGTPTRLANGNAGQVLTSAGTTLAPYWSDNGAGDMILASVQTNSGAKTFLDSTMLLRNVANTFSSKFTNTNTAARTYTLKDADGTLAFTSDLTGYVTAVSIATANGVSGSSSGGTTPALTITLGAITPTSVNGLTITANGTNTLNITAGKTLAVTNTITLSGTDSTIMTFPTTSKTLAANDGSNMTLASQATGDIILAASASTLGILADVAVGQPLLSGGVGVAPAYAGYTFSGTAAQTYTFPATTGTLAKTSDIPSKTSAFVYIIDGGGSAITTGSKGFLQIPAAYTITGWTLVADQVGSAVIDVKKSTYANFPTTSSICAADLPTLSAVQKNQNLSAGTWTTAVSAGDVLEFVVNSAATVTKLSLTIVATKT